MNRSWKEGNEDGIDAPRLDEDTVVYAPTINLGELEKEYVSPNVFDFNWLLIGLATSISNLVLGFF